MNAQTEKLLIPGAAGAIEVARDLAPEARGVAVGEQRTRARYS